MYHMRWSRSQESPVSAPACAKIQSRTARTGSLPLKRLHRRVKDVSGTFRVLDGPQSKGFKLLMSARERRGSAIKVELNSGPNRSSGVSVIGLKSKVVGRLSGESECRGVATCYPHQENHVSVPLRAQGSQVRRAEGLTKVITPFKANAIKKKFELPAAPVSPEGSGSGGQSEGNGTRVGDKTNRKGMEETRERGWKGKDERTHIKNEHRSMNVTEDEADTPIRDLCVMQLKAQWHTSSRGPARGNK
ncbi:hypothetical protein B0H19DRAFT_1082476 [Mycena capillaripes]|nr:hypothetical protein B0H19DRAFT_1082476 [Mycena capillaripes]